MQKKINTLPMVRLFAPEIWREVERFSKFHQSTYSFKTQTQKELSGITSHFEKAMIFEGLAKQLAKNIEIDERELQENGFTPANNARPLSATVESIFLELYSSIDCTCKIIKAIYKNTRGLPDSTRKMFERIQKNELNNDFPEELKLIFQNASWYTELLNIRDELTHASVGICHKNGDKIDYIHHGVKQDSKAVHYTDVFYKTNELINATNRFLETVFQYLNTTLEAKEIDIGCGIFFGRYYYRKVAYDLSLNINSGICQSKQWFDLPENKNFKCPLIKYCGAYLK